MSGVATVVGVVAGAASVASSVNNLVNSPSGGGGGGTVSSSSPSGGGLNITQSQYAYYGPHPSTTPMNGSPAPKPATMSAPKAGVAETPTVSALRKTPSQGSEMEANEAQSDFKNMWADRLSHYLDYNTRSIG